MDRPHPWITWIRDHPPLRIAVIYALVAGLWILASDAVLGLLVRDPATLTRLATLKGWCFVAVTAALLYALVQRDILRLRKTEAEARRLLDIQTLIVDNSVVGIAFVRRRRFIWANQRMADMLGVPLDQVQGAPVRLVYTSEESFESLGERIYPALSRGEWFDFETTLHRQDGTPFAGRIFGKALDPAAPQEGSVWIFEDVTERRRSEEALRRAQKLDSLGQLAGGMAHDTNNMLGVIIGYVDLLLAEAPEGCHADLQQIRKAALHSADLARQLLAFARKQAIQPAVLDLNTVVEDTRRMLGRLIGEQHTLAFRPAPGLWPVWADPSQIDQILANLVVNARDALGTAGTITLETRNTAVDAAYVQFHPEATPGDFAVLAVTDTGCGMTPEIQARIFDPFFTTKGPGRGTGLGLATVYGIVRQSRGFITVYSAPGMGTTFRIHLPRCSADETARMHAQEPRSPGGSETLLLVEDEEALLELGRRILEEAGYKVLALPRPLEALQLSPEQLREISLLATDLVMPGLDGRELYVRLRAARPELRALFLSGYPTEALGPEFLPGAGTGFLQKPFTRSALLAKVREVLDAGGPSGA
jgi:PAS domain S-box-containing protein